MTNSTLSETAAPPAAQGGFRWWMGAAMVALLVLLGAVALQMRQNGPLAAGPVGQGEVAPNFTLMAFEKTQWGGQTFEVAALRGQVVVVNFWASWCKPCEQEAAELENSWRHYKDQGVMFLGVDYVDTETEAMGYLTRFDITYPNGPDLQTKISAAYRIKGVPETYFIDKNGVLAFVKIGPITQEELSSVLESLLK